MKNVFIINAHEAYPFAPGRLNQTFVDKAKSTLQSRGYEIRYTSMKDDYNVQEEIEKHRWADVILLQSPVNWMGVPWSFKKYMDLVYTAGMDGGLCTGDGRTEERPKFNYGGGGSLTGRKYMLSLTFNAPRESFDDPAHFFFGGKSVDDLFWPTHLNFKFFGMEPLPTFSSHDVMKNPEVEADFVRFGEHLNQHFPAVTEVA